MMETAAQNLGKQLQTKREQLGFSLQDVALHTRIRKVYLESMEKGQLEDLPGQAYITGFVRVYARHLGLDSNSLLALLENSREAETAQAADAISEDKSQAIPPVQPAAGKGWGAFVIGFLMVLVFGGLFYFLPSMLSTETPVETVVEDAVKVPEPASPQETDVITVVEPAAEPTVEPALEPATESSAVAPLEPEAKPDVEVVAAAPAEEKPIEEPLPTVPQAGSSLRMLALTESSLIIYVDDRKPHEYKLYDGLDLTWKIKNKVRVEMAEPGAAQFWLGGQELPIKTLGSFQLQPASGD